MQKLEIIEIGGQKVINLQPQNTNILALVDFNVLQRLAGYLPVSNLDTIKDSLITRVHESHNLEGFVATLKDEVAFHESVNLIQTVDPQRLVSESQH